jgi:putative hydrolase of the HAD superfamily
VIRPFRAALFDLDDTLHDDGTTYRTAALRAAGEVAHEHGVAPEALVAAYVAELERFWLRLSAGDLRVSIRRERVRMWTTALERLGVEDDRAALAERLANAYVTHRDGLLQPYPGALDLLARLRAAGHKTGLITNGFAETHRDKVALLGFGSAFDTVVFADQVGFIKPDPRIFLHALEQIGVAARDGVMVGDRYERDVRGAAEVGLATVWLNQTGESVPAGGPTPDVIVTSFDDVPKVLGFAGGDAAATPAAAARS